jgi:hypothetical protein
VSRYYTHMCDFCGVVFKNPNSFNTKSFVVSIKPSRAGDGATYEWDACPSCRKTAIELLQALSTSKMRMRDTQPSEEDEER